MAIIRKTTNVFKNLRFCGKRKNYTLQLTSILKRLTLTRLQAFTLRIVTLKIYNSSLRFCVDHRFLYPFSFLPRAWILPGMKTSSTNLVRTAGRPISFHRLNPWGWTLKRGGVYLMVSFPWNVHPVVARCMGTITA